MKAKYLSMNDKQWQDKLDKAKELLSNCRLCHFNCEVNRVKGDKGVCGAADRIEIASYSPHFGEEKPLVGTGGSGTVFFSRCNLSCVFCQNYRISQYNRRKIISEY